MSNKSISFSVQSVEPANYPIIIVVRLLKKTPISTLIEKVLEKGPPPSIHSEVPLRGICPLTHKILQQPARGVNCSHAECFDLSGYISFASKLDTWICPICNSECQFEDLRVDPEYLAHVGDQ